MKKRIFKFAVAILAVLVVYQGIGCALWYHTQAMMAFTKENLLNQYAEEIYLYMLIAGGDKMPDKYANDLAIIIDGDIAQKDQAVERLNQALAEQMASCDKVTIMELDFCEDKKREYKKRYNKLVDNINSIVKYHLLWFMSEEEKI